MWADKNQDLRFIMPARKVKGHLKQLHTASTVPIFSCVYLHNLLNKLGKVVLYDALLMDYTMHIFLFMASFLK